MKEFKAKITIKDKDDDIAVIFEIENYGNEKIFEFEGYPDTGEAIHDFLLGQVARVLDIEDILRRE